MESWKQFEDKVRFFSSLIWKTQCIPQNIAGVDIDGVMRRDNDYILVEITVREDLSKVREDIGKLNLARTLLFSKFSNVKCYVVMKDEPTRAMYLACSEFNIEISSFDNFLLQNFFHAQSYFHARSERGFGSLDSANAIKYIPVPYRDVDSGCDMTVEDMIENIYNGKSLVLTGAYGSGKSRCLKEIFDRLVVDYCGVMSSVSTRKKVLCPIAINLREMWGLESYDEIIARHFARLGLDSSDVLRNLKEELFVFLLDGFDEIGFQSWSNNPNKQRALRKKALQGVAGLIREVGGRVVVAGRSQYFNSDSEMLECLGFSNSMDFVVCDVYEEFSELNMREFLGRIGSEYTVVPTWLPKRPLVCQILAGLAQDDVRDLLHFDGDEIGFWGKFADLICEREALIGNSLDSQAIRGILRAVADLTRLLSDNSKPIARKDIESVFLSIIGSDPSDESSLILHRLPGLARVSGDSDERVFVDEFLLEGFKGECLVDRLDGNDRDILSLDWKSYGKSLCIGVVSNAMLEKPSRISLYKDFMVKASTGRNKVLAGDLLSALIEMQSCLHSSLAVDSIILKDSHLNRLDMSGVDLDGVSIQSCCIDELILPSVEPKDFKITDCVIGKVFGVSSVVGIPGWIVGSDIGGYETVYGSHSLDDSGLSDAHKVLVSILYKLFNQHGSARAESAFYRGFVVRKAVYQQLVPKVLKVLESNGYASCERRRNELTWKPDRTYLKNVKNMLISLNRCGESVWLKVGAL